MLYFLLGFLLGCCTNNNEPESAENRRAWHRKTHPFATGFLEGYEKAMRKHMNG